jgi:NTE family protein
MAGSVDLVFEGGGVKGIGLAGAFAVLDEQGYRPHCVAGTSAGAITAALVAAGYGGSELQDVVLHQMKFSQFADPHPVDHLGLAGQGIAILKEKGINKGDFFLGWMRDMLAAKQVKTFGDLVNTDVEDGDPARYKLQVIASDVTERRMLVLPRDAQAHLGIAPEQLEVALAVRMSMSIPIFFDPVRQANPQTGHEHLIVDGGLLSNFPIWLFDCPAGQTPAWPTFGLLLVAPQQADPLLPAQSEAQADAQNLSSPAAFLKAIMDTAMQAHDRLYVEQANYARTIPIPTLGVRTAEFDIPADQAEALYKSGRDAATQFLAGWDFNAYIAEFRQGKEQSRRGDVVAKMATPAPA